MAFLSPVSIATTEPPTESPTKRMPSGPKASGPADLSSTFPEGRSATGLAGLRAAVTPIASAAVMQNATAELTNVIRRIRYSLLKIQTASPTDITRWGVKCTPIFLAGREMPPRTAGSSGRPWMTLAWSGAPDRRLQSRADRRMLPHVGNRTSLEGKSGPRIHGIGAQLWLGRRQRSLGESF